MRLCHLFGCLGRRTRSGKVEIRKSPKGMARGEVEDTDRQGGLRCPANAETRTVRFSELPGDAAREGETRAWFQRVRPSRSSPESGAGHRLGALQPERGPRPDVVSRLPGPSLLAPAFRFGHIELLGILKCPTLSSPLRICLCSSFCPECLCLP